MIDWIRFAERIRNARRVLLTAHVRPDGDCIGSGVAMHEILSRLGKDVRFVTGHAVPPALVSIDPNGLVRPFAELSETERAWIETVDLLIVLDTSSWQQLGPMSEIVKTTKAVKIVLDHHNIGDDLGAEMFVDKSAEATGRLVFDAARVLDVPLDRSISDPIFAAIATDTGWFRFSSVGPETFRTVGALLETGTRVDEQYRLLYEQETLGRVRLIGAALSKTESLSKGRLMFTSILLDDLAAAGALPSETEDIVNMTLQVCGSQAAVILVEQREGGFKISFRSRCEVDCSAIAKRFGGGGHKKAAGASINRPYEETRRLVIDALADALENLDIDAGCVPGEM